MEEGRPHALSSETRSALYDHVLLELRRAVARGADAAELRAAAARLLRGARQPAEAEPLADVVDLPLASPP